MPRGNGVSNAIHKGRVMNRPKNVAALLALCESRASFLTLVTMVKMVGLKNNDLACSQLVITGVPNYGTRDFKLKNKILPCSSVLILAFSVDLLISNHDSSTFLTSSALPFHFVTANARAR